jgi:hypothetical protein
MYRRKLSSLVLCVLYELKAPSTSREVANAVADHSAQAPKKSFRLRVELTLHNLKRQGYVVIDAARKTYALASDCRSAIDGAMEKYAEFANSNSAERYMFELHGATVLMRWLSFQKDPIAALLQFNPPDAKDLPEEDPYAD